MKRQRENTAECHDNENDKPTSDVEVVSTASKGVEVFSLENDNNNEPINERPEKTTETSLQNEDKKINDYEDDEIFLPKSVSRATVKKGSECPYLDTISRQNLDFDFEKCCSVSLSHVNVYVCLVCGKYFQGRGLNTHAYTHSLETAHHMFMKIDSGKVYCLPDNYEVVDSSLDDIRHMRNPCFSAEEMARIRSGAVKWSRTLDSTEYMPGLVGINNEKAHDYANCVVQMLVRVLPLRDFLLDPANTVSTPATRAAGTAAGPGGAGAGMLVPRLGELCRKLWNTRNFRGQVSPHEFMQAVLGSSAKRFSMDRREDPVTFWTWFVNAAHMELTGGRPKRPSIFSHCFQGELEVTTLAGTGRARGRDTDLVERVPFRMLGMDLPPAPLFKDALEKNIIPQVPIFQLLAKYDGVTVTDDLREGRRKFRILQLPRYLVIQFKRFVKNNFFTEKNPTIVNFPVKNLDLKDFVASEVLEKERTAGQEPRTKYDLVSNLVHDGKAGEGSYRVFIHRKAEDVWYEVQDLRVTDILPQMVALSEAYFQVYELKDALGVSPAAPAAAVASRR